MRVEQPIATSEPLWGNIRTDALCKEDMTTIAIIGGGFSGICVAAHLHRNARRPVRILVFERKKIGAGIAFGTHEPVHFLNGPASNHSPFDDRPDEFTNFLANEPEAIPGAIEECLRWVTPIQQFARTVVADTTVGGVEVRADEYLLMIYASGNRDESAFGPTADEFDAFRPVTTPNLAFGFGEHLCLGAALARLEARVFLEEMLARFPEYEVTGPGEYVRSNLVRGYESLPFRTG